jgi:hypothetical protein
MAARLDDCFVVRIEEAATVDDGVNLLQSQRTPAGWRPAFGYGYLSPSFVTDAEQTEVVFEVPTFSFARTTRFQPRPSFLSLSRSQRRKGSEA